GVNACMQDALFRIVKSCLTLSMSCCLRDTAGAHFTYISEAARKHGFLCWRFALPLRDALAPGCADMSIAPCWLGEVPPKLRLTTTTHAATRPHRTGVVQRCGSAWPS